jgi:RNA polymerase sigma-70 factor (ECF subfamily)
MHPGPAGSAQGADALLRRLYAEHGPVLLRLATQLARGDSASAEDLVQEAMLRAWRHRATTDFTVGSPRGWLTTTIRNLAIDAHRARQARPAEAGPDALPTLVSPSRPDSAIDRWPLRAAIAALPPHHRQVVVEIYYRDRSVADTAQALHIPLGTVKSRLYYALGALRRGLAADDAAA